MLKLKLKEVLQERGILRPFTWLKNEMGFNSPKVTKLLNGTQESLSFKDMDTICQKLDCTPNALFYYVQDGRQTAIAPDHALNSLTPPNLNNNWNKILNQLPPKRLAELAHEINKDVEYK